MKGQTYVITGIIIFIIISIFAVTNVESVRVNYLFWSGESPLILVILFSVLMGGLVTAAVGSVKIFHLLTELNPQSYQVLRDQVSVLENNVIDAPQI